MYRDAVNSLVDHTAGGEVDAVIDPTGLEESLLLVLPPVTWGGSPYPPSGSIPCIEYSRCFFQIHDPTHVKFVETMSLKDSGSRYRKYTKFRLKAEKPER